MDSVNLLSRWPLILNHPNNSHSKLNSIHRGRTKEISNDTDNQLYMKNMCLKENDLFILRNDFFDNVKLQKLSVTVTNKHAKHYPEFQGFSVIISCPENPELAHVRLYTN